MRLSIGRVSVGGHTASGTADCDDTGTEVFGAAWRRMALALSAVLILGCVGILFSPAKPAGAAGPTTFASGQVFASVGGGTVNVYDPASGNLLNSFTDNSGTTYNAGSTFDSNGNLYVNDDDAGQISEFNSSGTQIAQLTGLTDPYGDSNDPLSSVFDNAGNLYVGQQSTPYIAEFNSSGVRQPDIGPLQTQLYGDDWIDLAPDEHTFYYTTEGNEILTYNDQTNAQGPVFNQVPFPSTQLVGGKTLANQAFELKILANGEVLVADSSQDILLNADGSVNHVYPCSSMPGCGTQLFAISVDPSGTSFWTADSSTGNIYQINIATGAVMQTINTGSGTLYGLSVDNQLEVANPQLPTSSTPPPVPATLTVQPVAGNFSSPTPVSAVLTNSSDQPIVNEPVTFTLNGSETCTATTDNTGTATCTITPGEPSSSYTLTASFGGDTSTSTPIGSDSTSSTFTVSTDSSTVTYTGPTTAVNGQPITLTGNLTTNTPTSGTPLPTKVVTFTIGSGSTAQSCSGTTDANGNVSCTIATVDQPASSEPITAGFAGDSYDTTANATSTLSVTEPTVLTVSPASGPYSGSTTVTGTLTDAVTNAPIANEPVTFTVNGAVYCTGTTNSSGIATCSATPTEGAGTYTLTGTFGGDTTLPLQLTGTTSAPVNFTVTPAPTSITYAGATSTFNGQSVTLSGLLTSGGSPVAGQTVTLTLGSGSGTPAQTCTAVTGPTGAASCTIQNVNQPVGPNPVTVTYAGTTNYQPSNDAPATVQVGPATTSSTVKVTTASGSYGSPVTVSATLIDTYTGSGAANETITFTVGTQHCTGVTNASGVASCPITPTGPAGTYSVTASFSGDSTLLPALLANTGSNTLTETTSPTTLTYTGSTTVTSGKAPSLSAVLTTTGGTPLSGQTVTFSVGSGSSAQKCSGTTNASGAVSCSICMFNQSASPLPVTVTYGGTSYYAGSGSTQSVTVTLPTNLSVSATTGAMGQTTTVTGTLTNAVTGTPISGQTITLTLGGVPPCTATTNSSGKASCTVTPTQASGTYSLNGTFAGNTGTSPQLLTSSGSNNFVVTKAPTTLTYTGAASVTSGQTLTLTSLLTSNGTPIVGQPVVMTLGTSKSAQSCTGTTASSGVASCTVTVNQVTGSVSVTASYAGNTYYQSSAASSSEQIGCTGGGGSGGGGSGGGSGGGCGGCGGGCRPPVGGCGEGCG